MGRPISALLLATLITITACAPGGQGRTQSQAAPGTGQDGPPKTLTFGLNGEPKVLGGMIGLGNESNRWGDIQGALHQRLTSYNERGEVQPQLAAEVPSQANGTWVLRADGTMQTTYRLRPGFTWHDGAPLTAADFVFAWTVVNDRELPITTRPVAAQLTSIDTPDDHTIVLEWARVYPFANAIVEDDLGPLPAHILESAYTARDPDRFIQQPFWTREFVGVGPYRLTEWEPGSHMVLKAHDRFAGERARIETIVVRFLPDGPAAVANLLSSAVDGVTSGLLSYEEALFVKNEWERAGQKPTTFFPTTHWRTLAVQLRPAVVSPPELLEINVRKGLLHALDRQALVDAVFGGLAPAAHGIFPPDDPRWDWIEDVSPPYAYDQRLAVERLTEGGWRRGVDGRFVRAGGERIALSLWTTPGNEREPTIVADDWKAIGFDVDLTVLAPGDARDTRITAAFPGLMVTSFPISFQFSLDRTYGPSCPTEANRFAGVNRGCYQSAENDRLTDAIRVAIDPDEQRRAYRAYARLQTEDLPALPLFFPVQAWVFREGVTGLKLNANHRAPMWNAAEWDIRR